MRRLLLCCLFVALVGALAVATPARAHAATFAVTNTDDSGPGSLRGAVQAARAADGADTITFQLSGCPCVIRLTGGLISILDPLTIEGPGADMLAVSGNHNSRIFDVGSAGEAIIGGLTLRDGAGADGGITNRGTLTITNSTVSHNAAVDPSPRAGSGGGITNRGTLTITNSTVSGNSAALSGGGIANINGTLTVTNSTVTNNSAIESGGGVHNASAMILRNSLVAANTAPLAPDVWDEFGTAAGSYNLIGDGELSHFADRVNGNLVGTAGAPIDPLLGPLADNGGPTWTHALLAGSPAIDHIPAGVSGCGDPIGTDQRGVARPQGAGCDIGAFELRLNQPPAVTITEPADSALLAAGSIALTARFSDPDAGDVHTCRLLLGDGDDATADPVIDGSVSEPGTDPGACTASQQLGAGVYSLTVTVTDAAGEHDSDTVMFVVYDPSAGFVSGGGWLVSEPGDCALDAYCAAASGKASFGFVSGYKKGASIPTGSTQFVFSAGGLSFHSNVYDWLVVNQSQTHAQYKGSGTVNSHDDATGPYKFMLWATDGANTGTADTFRIKIWSEQADPDSNQAVETVVYDNAASTTPDAIAGGSIVIKTR